MTATIHIGTSGWHYKDWMSVFYPTGSSASNLLKFYARHFDTVEINNSFYKLPTIQTFQKMARRNAEEIQVRRKSQPFHNPHEKIERPWDIVRKVLPGYGTSATKTRTNSFSAAAAMAFKHSAFERLTISAA